MIERSAKASTQSPSADAREERYRIAHLSDLHFGRGWSEENWHYVWDLLREFRPHLLVVTGDVVDNPTLFMLAMVRNELEALVRDLGQSGQACEFVIVPGNHDVGILGNVHLWPWRGKFDLVFSRRHRVFDAVGRWQAHHELPPWRRLARWMRWTSTFALRRVSFGLRGTRACAEPSVTTTDRGGIVLGRFDSNHRAKLATGRVSAEALMSLETKLHFLAHERHKAFFGPRIALLHHHALAIPYSTAFESLTSFEPFLALRNSGDLLHVLGLLEFDLVLHGHKHYWNFARVSFDAPGAGASEVAIVAAGSATLRRPESRWNTFNLFEVLPNGMITHRQHRYALGVTARASEALARSEERWLSSAQNVKERMHRKAVRLLESNCDTIERSVVLDEDGSARFGFGVLGLRVTGVQALDRFRFVFAVENGAVNPASAELDPETAAFGHRLDVDRHARPGKRLDLPVVLAAELHRDQRPLDLAVTCRTINTFAISAWEARLLPPSDPSDWVSATVRHPADRLRLTLELPSHFVDPAPQVRVMRPAHYPTLDLDTPSCEVVLAADGVRWIEDVEMTQLESARLREIADHRFELEVERPLVGYRYALRWRVQTDEPEADPLALGVARQVRETLVRMVAPGVDAELVRIRTLGQAMFDEIFREILLPTFRSAYLPGESLSAALFVLDESSARPVLRFVLGSSTGPALGAATTEIPLNEGVAGTAFKKRHLSVYAAPEIFNADSAGAYVYYPGELPPERERFAVLAAVPVYLTEDASQRDVTPEELIGVFTLGTNAKDSGLLRLIEPTADDTQGARPARASASDGEEAHGDDVYLVWTLALQFMRGLAATIAEAGQDVDTETP